MKAYTHREVSLALIKVRCAKVGFVFLTDSPDETGKRWPYAMRRGRFKIWFAGPKELLAALRGQEKLQRKEKK